MGYFLLLLSEMYTKSQISNAERSAIFKNLDPRVKGTLREDLFYSAWRTCKNPPEWFVRVRMSNKLEDCKEHIDAYLYAKDAIIPIQIKGSYIAMSEFREFYGERYPKIVLVLINEGFTPEQIIRTTLEAVYAKYPGLGGFKPCNPAILISPTVQPEPFIATEDTLLGKMAYS